METTTTTDDSPPTPTLPTPDHTISTALKELDLQTNPWIEQAVQQAITARKSAQEGINSALSYSQSRLSQIRSTSSAHFSQSLESLKEVKDVYRGYEQLFFAKLKEGAVVAADHPFVTAGATVGLGCLAFKAPRRFLYYRTLRLFASDEVLLSRADAKVKDLRQSVQSLKAEAEKLEKRASYAEEEFKRGATKLRHAGIQIRKAVLSADKIDKQARGLKDVLADLPRSEASKFHKEISHLVAEAKQERKVLAKEVTKISNYGISV